ncbi:MAG: YbaN family protein [Alphaproteobacteria bacterium]
MGVVGFALPVLPSTVFILIALWVISRGSPRFENWLFSHRLFGQILQTWRRHRVIPAKANLMALACLATSLLIVFFIVAESWPLALAVGLVMTMVAAFNFRFPRRVPAEPR